jgi:hypothetical protein
MQRAFKIIIAAGVGALGGLPGLATAPARAHDFGNPGAGPGYRYYGNGGHDAVPHWHNTYTPFGAVPWFGVGAHDFRPHEHTVSPAGGYRGYSATPFGLTESIYPSTPYTYMPW